LITLIRNGEEIQLSEEGYDSFGSFYDAHKVDGEVLAFLSINDQEIPVDRVQELAKARFEGGEKIVMDFEPAVRFTLKLLANIEDYIHSFQKAVPQFASSIAQGDPKALESMSNVYEGIKALETMKESLFALTGTTISDFGQLKTKESELTGILRQINQDLESKNFESLAKVLGEQLPESLSFYHELFAQAKELLIEKRS
jgi:hypothetical protein